MVYVFFKKKKHTILPLALVGYEMDMANRLSIISYPTRARGIIV